ncbi:MAG: tRNA 2-thiouridine(34) synthase MnmA [bacterium]|nr:tRNA 2-thiouridine(34) synthase MnmA [bacterium]
MRVDEKEAKMGLKDKIAVGLSGGVDSAVTAFLLKEQGYQVTGVYLSAWCNKQAREDKESAGRVAAFLGIDFQVLDIRREYRQRVIDWFFDEYKKGRVPSPDIVCNREIKFGLFLNWARKQGFDKVATGHYAKLAKAEGRWAIFRPVDKSKDQTYFLYQLKEEVLDYVVWPLGGLTKGKVRQMAGRIDLPNKNRPESMGICFVGEVDIVKFLQQRIPIQKGKVVLPTGEVVGEHKGVWFYTLGQRHGFLVKRPAKMPTRYLYKDGSLKPLYVIGKDMDDNKLIVSVKEDCMITKIVLEDLRTVWADEGQKLKDKMVRCRVRNLGRLHAGRLRFDKAGWRLELSRPIFITSPGQSVVFYDEEDRLIGGGVVEGVEGDKLKVQS